MSVEKGTRSLVALGVVAVAETVDADAAVARRRMHEARVADVDADVRERGVARVEEDEVAGTQQVALDRPALGVGVGVDYGIYLYSR